MDGLALLGIFLILYSIFVVYVAIKKPKGIWSMKKIEGFKKVLGEKGTVIFFYVFATIALIAGIWLLAK